MSTNKISYWISVILLLLSQACGGEIKTEESVNPEDSLAIRIDTTYLAKPRRKAFKKFLHGGGFGNGEVWVRVKTSH